MIVALVDIGVLLGFWGMLWYAWDHNADAPAYLLVSGLALMLIFGFML